MARRYLLQTLAILLIASGVLAASSSPEEAEAQPTGIELGALCVHFSTGAVSAPINPTAATCPPGHFILPIPDAFPFILAIHPFTQAVIYTPTPLAGYINIQLPDAGIVPFCMSLYTRQLNYSPTNTCPFGSIPVLLVGEIAPEASDDGPFFVLINTTLDSTVTPADDNLLSNDDLGLPAGTLTHFGGGSLGGLVTDNGAGASVALAGGTLQVNADGSFSLANPTVPGDYSFAYRLTNAAGTDDAMVTIQVQQLPDAVDDGLYTVLEGGTLTLPADGLLDNDILGFPTAQLVSFGASDATATAAGNSIALAGGTLTVNPDGSFELATPTTGGQYTFLYRLQNGAGFDDATVTIEVQRAPEAVDDGPYVTTIGVDINLAAPGLLANDDTGFPTTGIDNFGGGSLGGLVTDNGAGVSVAFAGGTLTINPNGSFSLTSPTVAGDYTVDYRLSNPAGTSDATVTIQIQGPPTANDDGPAAASAPGDLFHTALNTSLDSTATGGDDNLRSNDDLGFPAATISSFGGGDLGGVVTANAAGATVSPLPQGSGSLTVNGDGSFVFTPPTNFSGLYSFDYRLTNAAGTSDATVTIAVGARPVANDDSYLPTVLGNVSIDTTTSSSFSVLSNDGGDGLTITASDATSVNGGDVNVNADGTFSYDPAPGYEGADSFTYTIDNGFSDSQVGTVNLTVSGMIWFIDQSAADGGDGRLSGPFNCLVSATCFSTLASDDPGDSIFLASGSYTGGLTLLDNQLFIGEGATATISTITGLVPPADSPTLPTTSGTNPQITTTNADGITLGSGNTIRGLNIGNTGTGTGIDGTSFGTLTLSEVSISGTGRAVNLSTGTAAVTFDSLASNGSSGNGIDLSSVGGSFTVTGVTDIDNPTSHGISIANSGGSFNFQGTTSVDGGGFGLNLSGSSGGSVTFASVDIDGTSSDGVNIANMVGTVNLNGGSIGVSDDPGGDGLDIFGGTGSVTVAASVTKTSGNGAVEVTNRTAGTVTISGAVSCSGGCTGILVDSNTGGTTSFTGAVTTNTGTTTAVNLTNNTGHAIQFSGGLDIDTTSGTGLNATGGGTVEVLASGVTNTVDSTTGTAVNIQNTTIGAQDVTFRSVSSNGGANVGINLLNTGTTGGFSVTGDGGNTQNGSGGTITNKSGVGVRVNQASNVSLASMNITSTGDDGIFAGGLGAGDGVNGFSLRGVFLNNNGNAVGEHGVELRDVTGVLTFQNSRVTNSHEDGIRHFNDSGTVSSLTIDNVEIDNNSSGAGYNFEVLGSSNASLTSAVVTSSNFHDLFATGAFFVNNSNGSMTVTIGDSSGVTSNTFTNNNIAIDVSAGPFSNTTTFNVLNNTTITGSNSHAMNFFSADTGGNTSTNTFNGTISGNVIGGAGAGSGSAIGNGIRVNVNDPATARIRIESNTVNDISANGRGMELVSRLGNNLGTMHLTLLNNSVTTAMAVNGLAGIFISADENNIVANIRGNTVSGNVCEDFGAPGFVFFGCDILVQEATGSTFELERDAGGDPPAANAREQILNTNTAVNGNVEEIDAGGAISTNITFVAPGTVLLP